MRLDGFDAAAVEQAAGLLAAGELVAFATETVYGLGARADDARAVGRIFSAKGRPANHPLIVHVGDPSKVAQFASSAPPVALRLMAACWPGPLTLILPRRPEVAEAAAGGQSSIGLRCPAHPVAQALLAAAFERGVPGVAAPSANRFGRISPTTAAHVASEFGAELPVLDGGACALGIESSIVDCSRGRPVLLRPGTLTRARLEAAAGEPLHAPDADAPRAPGMLAAHYAPNAKLRLMPTRTLHTALHVLGEPLPTLAVYSRGAAPAAARGLRHRRMPESPAQVAHELFAVLRELDAEGVQLIWVEEPPPEPEWDGVRDRLARAAAA
ncbi:MAG TPA: L-threonylcarbamoyladenylate synthase [Burkholderiaceae bacterium]|nr:L-threonylcarbamoyladenylate synthase [Burkholderiaceae bacterium]